MSIHFFTIDGVFSWKFFSSRTGVFYLPSSDWAADQSGSHSLSLERICAVVFFYTDFVHLCRWSSNLEGGGGVVGYVRATHVSQLMSVTLQSREQVW